MLPAPPGPGAEVADSGLLPALCLSQEPFLLRRASRKRMTPSAGSHLPLKYYFKPI